MEDVTTRDWLSAREGDEIALARLFDAHSDRVFRHAQRLLVNHEDAKDAVVIAFYELWRKRASVRVVDGSPVPWLLNTVSNVARNLERSARRYRSLIGRLDPPVQAHDPSVLDESHVMTVLRQLPPREQSVISLSIVEGYSEREVAQLLNIPVGTVKSRLSRAKARLRADLIALEDEARYGELT